MTRPPRSSSISSGFLSVVLLVSVSFLLHNRGFAQGLTVGAVNNVIQIDGLTNTSPQSPGALPTLVNGGKIAWHPSAAVTNTSINWFGNTQTIAAPVITLTTLSCPSTLTSGSPFTAMLVFFDQVGDIAYSAQNANIPVTSGSLCPQLSSNPLANNAIPGAVAFMLAGCQGSNCGGTLANLVVLATSSILSYSASLYGPFTSSATNFQPTFAAPNTVGPFLPNSNTNGLIVPNINLELGSSTWVTSAPIATGSYTRITGDNGKSTIVQVSQGFPSAIPALGEPGGIVSNAGSNSGTVGNSETVAFGLYDGCNITSGTGTLVSLGPPHTFPPFVSGMQALTIPNPGITAATAPWSANAQYWGSSTTCAGERVVVTAGAQMLVLVATTSGLSSSSQPIWTNTSVCSSIAVGTLCLDNQIRWKIQLVAGSWNNSQSHTRNSNGSVGGAGEVWDSGTNSLWEDTVSGNCTTATTGGNPFTGKMNIGDVVTGDGSCSWINVGLSYLINPGFGVFSADCTPNQTTVKQCSSGPAAASPYLSQLFVSSAGEEFNWSGCTRINANVLATCDSNQSMTFSTVVGTGGGSQVAANLTAPTAQSCSASGFLTSGCNSSSSTPLYLQAVWSTPDGPGVPGVELSVTGFSTGQAFSGTSPSSPPPNAVGYLIYASNGSIGGSANNQMQVPDGIQFVCGAYVSSLPYGRLCAPGSTWTMNVIQSTGKVPTHNVSGTIISLGGPALLPPWGGGCYGVQLSNFFIEAAPNPPSVVEPFSWAIFNQSCEESTSPDSLTVADAQAGAAYVFGPAAQNSWLGYLHTIGSQSDYYIGMLVENVNAFHNITEFSYGPALGTQWLGRSCIYVMQSLVSQVFGAGGVVENYHCEAALEQLTVSNTPLIARNNFGRQNYTASCCRAPLYGAHVDQYSQGVDLSEIWAGGTTGSSNIQDDACNAVNPATTVGAVATAHYIRDANSLGQASCNQFVLNTDPAAVSLSGKQLALSGATSGTVGIAPASTAGTWTLTLPTSAGSNGQFLQTNGAGSSTWATAGSGTVNSATANQIAYYGSTGNAVSGDSNWSDNSGVLTGPTVNATSAYQLNGTQIQASAIVVAFCLGSVGTTSGTFVLTPGTSVTNANCSGTTTAVEVPMPYACTAKNLYVVGGTAGNSATGSGVTTLYKNNGATGSPPKCTLGTGTSCHDIIDTVSFNAGDTWSVRTTSNGSGETLANVRASFQCQ